MQQGVRNRTEGTPGEKVVHSQKPNGIWLGQTGSEWLCEEAARRRKGSWSLLQGSRGGGKLVQDYLSL